jgi:hypothetical protein
MMVHTTALAPLPSSLGSEPFDQFRRLVLASQPINSFETAPDVAIQLLAVIPVASGRGVDLPGGQIRMLEV